MVIGALAEIRTENISFDYSEALLFWPMCSTIKFKQAEQNIPEITV